MYSSLARLCDELIERSDFTEPDILSDWCVYKVRMTHLLGLMGLYGLWRTSRIRDGIENPDDIRDRFLRRFCIDNYKLLYLWGEYTIPQWLAFIFYYRTIDASPLSDHLYYVILTVITSKNGVNGDGMLANPYYDPETFIPYAHGLKGKPLNDSFSNSSYSLEGVLHLYIRENYVQSLKSIFPSITHIAFHSFVPDESWQGYLYKNEAGKNVHSVLQPPHILGDLRRSASECEGQDVPELLREHPIQYLAFLLVYPHRANSSGLRWVSANCARDK